MIAALKQRPMTPARIWPAFSPFSDADMVNSVMVLDTGTEQQVVTRSTKATTVVDQLKIQSRQTTGYRDSRHARVSQMAFIGFILL